MRIYARRRTQRTWHLVISYKVPLGCSRYLCAASMTTEDATDPVDFFLFGPRQSALGRWRLNPFRCKRSWADTFGSHLIYSKMCLSRYCLIRPDQPFNRFVELRWWLPVRVDFSNSAQRLLHAAHTHRQPRLLRGRDGLPSSKDADLPPAARSAAANTDGACFGGVSDPLTAVGIACRHARLLRAEAGLQMKA